MLLRHHARRRAFGTLASFRLPEIRNEPFKYYPPGSAERTALTASLNRVRAECPHIPLVINGKEVFTNDNSTQYMPTDRKHAVCTFSRASESHVKEAIVGALEARKQWSAMPFEDRAAIFLKAADLVSTKYRADVCATTMLGTGKNAWQAEIDAAVETIDFWRFNAKYAQEIYATQPPENSPGVWNRLEFRPLEGFIAAISPFNFLAIGSNLGSAPAQMGNVALWKPAETTILGSYLIHKILTEAGLPPGVIQFLPGPGPVVGDPMLNSPHLAGVHFTGSTSTFNYLWRKVASNLDIYKGYPRIVGETGGKNFHFVHESAKDQIDSIVYHTVRGAFEYNGQKCSATSRMYVPDTLWPEFKTKLLATMKTLKQGQPEDWDTFVTAVIDEASFDKIMGYLNAAKTNPNVEILAGGNGDKTKGFFIEPTIILSKDARSATMCDELFGPVLTIHVYNAKEYKETLELCDSTSPYALTGALFSSDRYALELGSRILRNAAGNFYINDKSTGSIVGQQPFGGSRRSGTNDKSGSAQSLLRWVSARSIKESFVPITGFTYPSMLPDPART